MATLVQTTSVGSADFANATVTFSSPVTAGNVIIVYGAVEEFGTPAPALSSNRGDTFVTTSQNNNNNAAVLARIDSAVGGSTTITLTGGSFHRLVAQEWSGMTYDATAGTGTATATATITATTPGSATAASTSFSTFAVRTGDTYGAQTAPTGYTESGRFTSGTRGQFIGAYRAETTSGAKSAQWVDPPVNGAGDSRAAIIFNFADAGGGTTHDATGALANAGATTAGTATRFRTLSASGALANPGATTVGSASSATPRPSSGALVAGGATLSGSAARVGAPPNHVATGALSNPGGATVGAASSATPRPSSGVLVGAGAVTAGAANRTPAPVTHNATGALANPGALLFGFANNESGQVVDTHDGFWAREYRKMWEYKKPTKAEIVEALEEDAAEVIESLPEIKREIRREYGRVDYSKIAENAQMLAFVAKQIQIAIELRRIELDEEDAEILLLM